MNANPHRRCHAPPNMHSRNANAPGLLDPNQRQGRKMESLPPAHVR